ncbi:MAG: TolC family protein [Desulfobacteraceae bacterium]|nr:TolC family protein [Desulfobacteraceae bacterium]
MYRTCKSRIIEWSGENASPEPRRVDAIKLPAFLRIGLLFWVLAWCGADCAPARAAVPDVPEDVPAAAYSGGPLDFNGCVGLALEQSPYLKSSSFEIEVRRLDESDSRFSFTPNVTLRTRYFPNPPKNVFGDSKNYSLGFFVDSYNPLESYYSLQARKLLTKMAIFGHLQVIAGFIQRLGNAFLELDSIDRTAALQEKLLDLAERNLAYARNRVKSGSAGRLEMDFAQQEIDLVKSGKERIERSRRTILDGTRGLLDIDPSRDLKLDLQEVRLQVIGGFDASSASLPRARSNSYELKILALKRELQQYNINLAYARFLPTLLLGVENGDPLSNNDLRGYYFFFGFEMPLWDGMKRSHNISRQKTILRQAGADEKTKALDFDAQWNSAAAKRADAVDALDIARREERLADLRQRQAEISYGEGRLVLPEYLAQCRASIESRKNSELKELEYAKATLALFALSGELSRRFVRPDVF